MNLSEHQIAEIVSRYKSGDTTRQLATLYSRTHQTINHHLKKQGVILRSRSEARRKHRLNESAFDSINEEGAYWIGFLMADGNVYEVKKGSPRIKLELARCDLAHIERFKRFLGASHPIHFYKSERRKPFSDNASLAVSSVKLAESLARYGVTPRKSFTARVIGLEYNRDFWRGMIDGDGYIAANGRKRFELIGSKASMEQFATFVEVNTNGFKPEVKPYLNIFKVELWGKNAVQTLNVLYKDCTIALPRKLERAKGVIEVLELGGRVKRKRRSKGLSLEQAALEINMSIATLSRIENSVGMPDAKNVARITAWLGASVIS
ncbi:MAG TPA: helix-turn-helix transcriptional regulator [Nitrososphaera sp.]|jgi:intein-encoded DNA endonuclease-like protein|nr:helix-turn-helix transcriptional regulator [Nitrososphaera sp.]